ncbi:putative SP-containing protein [Vairimorpha necatrix]|uniref:SP-containing protein n=1 Tax=Vairimorpha necatrix TaxID=6039 RepID=A0AAX4J9H6_9MICR
MFSANIKIILFYTLLVVFCSDNTESFYNNNSHNIQLYDLCYKRTAKDIVECEFIKRNLNRLNFEELNLLYNVIDNHLIKNKDDHYLLLVELGRSIDIYNELSEIRSNSNKINNCSEGQFFMYDDVFNEIQTNRKKHYFTGFRLKKGTSIHIKALKEMIQNLELTKNKKDFYIFICDFVEELIGILANNTHNNIVINSSIYFLNHYQTLEFSIRKLISTISLSKILYHTKMCILQETTINSLDLCFIIDQMELLTNIIGKFYEKIDKYLLPIQNICNLLKSEIKNKQ